MEMNCLSKQGTVYSRARAEHSYSELMEEEMLKLFLLLKTITQQQCIGLEVHVEDSLLMQYIHHFK